MVDETPFELSVDVFVGTKAAGLRVWVDDAIFGARVLRPTCLRRALDDGVYLPDRVDFLLVEGEERAAEQAITDRLSRLDQSAAIAWCRQHLQDVDREFLPDLAFTASFDAADVRVVGLVRGERVNLEVEVAHHGERCVLGASMRHLDTMPPPTRGGMSLGRTVVGYRQGLERRLEQVLCRQLARCSDPLARWADLSAVVLLEDPARRLR